MAAVAKAVPPTIACILFAILPLGLFRFNWISSCILIVFLSFQVIRFLHKSLCISVAFCFRKFMVVHGLHQNVLDTLLLKNRWPPNTSWSNLSGFGFCPSWQTLRGCLFSNAVLGSPLFSFCFLFWFSVPADGDYVPLCLVTLPPTPLSASQMTPIWKENSAP